MNCKCGKELEKYDTRYITDPIKQDFVCRRCWITNRENKKAEVQACCRCDKELNGKDFIDHRYCLGVDKTGKTGWNLFCIECQPYTEMAEYH
jgi:hypothetical protein